MALNEGGSNRTYLSISDGRIAKKCEANEAGAIACSNKDNTRHWYEKRFGSVSGFIKDVFKRLPDNPQFGAQLCIVIEDEGETYQLQMPWSSRYSSGFFMCMPNINTSRKIVFNPWQKEVEGQKKTMLYLKHEGEQDNIEWAWTKDDPKDLPQMVQMTVKGQKVWDDTARQEYFEKYLDNIFKPKLNASIGINEKKATRAAEVAANDDDSDLPF